MKNWHRLVAATIVLMILGRAGGPSAAPRPQAPAPRMGPDGSRQQALPPAEQAFRDALATKDREQKLRAFQQILRDWPESQAVKSGTVDFNILSLSTQAAGEAAKEARRAAEAFMRKVPATRDQQAVQSFLMAMAFSRADGLWPEVERYARVSLEYWDAEGAPTPPRHLQFDLERAVVLTLLGQALARQGRDNEAERYLREAYDARADEPGVVGQAVPALLELAKKRGQAEQQLEWLTALALYGHLTADRRKELEALFAASHGGLEGLEPFLDARYLAELPKAIPVERYERGSRQGVRTVLAEMFTGASCAPCVGMDLALEAAMRRYPPGDLAVLSYHVHSPAPDPLVNRSTETRAKAHGFRGAPHVAVDGGRLDDQGGGKAAEAGIIYRSRLKPALERALASPADAALSLRVARSGEVVRARAEVEMSGRRPAGTGPLRLHVALAEERVRYSGGNGIRFHPMVVRKMAGDGSGLPVAARTRQRIEVAFDLSALDREIEAYLDEFERKGNEDFAPAAFSGKPQPIDRSALVVVAFLEQEGPRRVLQAAVTPVGP